MRRFYYSLAYLLLLGIPASILTYLYGQAINLKALILVILLSLIVGGVFDIWGTRQGSKDKFFIWEYNSKSILGFKIFGVPVEDFVFFLILTPIFAISIYEAFKTITAGKDFSSPTLILGSIIMIVTYIFVYKHAIASKK